MIVEALAPSYTASLHSMLCSFSIDQYSLSNGLMWLNLSRKHCLAILLLNYSFVSCSTVYSVIFFKYCLPLGSMNIITKERPVVLHPWAATRTA